MKPAEYCGFSLATGVKIIGILFLILAIFIGVTVHPKDNIGIEESFGSYVRVQYFNSYLLKTVAVFFVQFSIAAALILVGVFTGNQKLLFTHVYIQCFFLIIIFILGVIEEVMFIQYFGFVDEAILFVLIKYGLIMAIESYFAWIVWSHAKGLEAMREQRNPTVLECKAAQPPYNPYSYTMPQCEAVEGVAASEPRQDTLYPSNITV